MGGRKQKKFVSMPPQTCFPCEMYSNALQSESRVHEQAVSKDFPRKKRNLSTFKNTVSQFKRGVNFPLHPTWKPTWVKRSEVFSSSRCLSSRLPREFVISSNVMRWWQISNTLPHQQPQNATTVEEDAAPIGPENKTKQKRRRSQEAGYPFHAPRLFACHLLHMIITTQRGIGG